ncbi:hypothetical protein [Nibribacter koreensis]|uniref:Tubulin/FtsZ 2-layer sandwich domain-containing protein n=1 Tax=Nibribacter koreensis TaxID=1084519 RepID=A0ABP8FQ15_9BACT
MNTSTKISAVLLGKLGEAVQNSLPIEKIPAMEIVTNLPALKEQLLRVPSLQEEVVLLVTEQEELTTTQLAELLQQRQAANFFTIVITVATNNLERQQEILALVDAMIVLPTTELVSPALDRESVNAICQTMAYLANLIKEALQGGMNVDFEDVKTVMRGSGASSVGFARAFGEERASQVTQKLMSTPFMKPGQLTNASKVLIQISSGANAELEMDELTEITDAIQEACGDECEVIFGHSQQDSLGQEIEVFLLATH